MQLWAGSLRRRGREAGEGRAWQALHPCLAAPAGDSLGAVQSSGQSSHRLPALSPSVRSSFRGAEEDCRVPKVVKEHIEECQGTQTPTHSPPEASMTGWEWGQAELSAKAQEVRPRAPGNSWEEVPPELCPS